MPANPTLSLAGTAETMKAEDAKYLRAAVVRYHKNVGMAVVKLILLRGTKGTKAADKAKYTAVIGALETVVSDLAKVLADAARPPATPEGE